MSDLPQVKERSQIRKTIQVLDTDGVGVAPSTLRWRVDCVTTQQEVLDWQEAAAVASQTITIPATANVIQGNANPLEVKRLSVQANYGTDSQLSESTDWVVVNNQFYT